MISILIAICFLIVILVIGYFIIQVFTNTMVQINASNIPVCNCITPLIIVIK